MKNLASSLLILIASLTGACEIATTSISRADFERDENGELDPTPEPNPDPNPDPDPPTPRPEGPLRLTVAGGYAGHLIASWDAFKTLVYNQQPVDSAKRPEGGDDFPLIRGGVVAKGLVVIVGGGGFNGETAKHHIRWSTDGRTWTIPVYSPRSWLGDAAYGNGAFVTAGGGGYSYISSDGKTWERIVWKEVGTGIELRPTTRTMAFGGGRFMACGNQGTFLSTDGRMWKLAGAVAEYKRCTHGNGRFISHKGFDVFHMPDGTNVWQKLYTVPGTREVASAEWVDGKYYVKAGSALYTSTNGTTWTTTGTSRSGGITATFDEKGERAFVSVDCQYNAPYSFKLYHSKDAVTWTKTVETTNQSCTTKVVTGVIP